MDVFETAYVVMRHHASFVQDVQKLRGCLFQKVSETSRCSIFCWMLRPTCISEQYTLKLFNVKTLLNIDYTLQKTAATWSDNCTLNLVCLLCNFRFSTNDDWWLMCVCCRFGLVAQNRRMHPTLILTTTSRRGAPVPLLSPSLSTQWAR